MCSFSSPLVCVGNVKNFCHGFLAEIHNPFFRIVWTEGLELRARPNVRPQRTGTRSPSRSTRQVAYRNTRPARARRPKGPGQAQSRGCACTKHLPASPPRPAKCRAAATCGPWPLLHQLVVEGQEGFLWRCRQVSRFQNTEFPERNLKYFLTNYPYLLATFMSNNLQL